MRISNDPMILDAPDLFGGDKDLYLKLKEEGAGKDVLLRVEHAMKHQPKPVKQSLSIPVKKRKPMKSLEDRLWARYRTMAIDPLRTGKLLFNGDTWVVPLPVLLTFVTLLEEAGRFHAESIALINWQIAFLSYMLNGKLELPTANNLDEKTASQQISKFIKGVTKLTNA